MTAWPDIARSMWDEYRQYTDPCQPVVPANGAATRERALVGVVPHLLDEISRRDMVLTRVRRLTATRDGLYDLPPDTPVPVSAVRAALDEKENNRG